MALSTETPRTATTAVGSGGLREVFELAYPVVLTQISATAMGVVDSAMVGRLGPTQLAAVGFGGIWMWTFFTLFYGTANAVQTFVSQADGAGRRGECGAWAWQGAYVVLPATLLAVLLVGAFVEPIIALLGPSPALQAHANTYIAARLPGEVGMALMMLLTSFFRGFGDTRTPLYVSLAANAVNAVLDYGLIFGELGLPAWGVRGAGTATAVGTWFAAGCLFFAFRRRQVDQRFRTRPVAPSRDAIRRFVRLGAPIGGQWCLGMTSFAMFTTLVARMGDAAMAASQAFIMLLSLSFMQAIGVSVAASTLVGRYVGAGDPEAASRSFRSSLWLGAMVGAAVGLLFVAVPGPLLRIFTDDPTVVELGVPLLAIGALFQFFDAGGIIAEGALRGAGDTRWPFVVHTALGWGFFVPVAYLLGVVLEGGLTGAWVGGTIYVVLMASVLIWRFRSEAWHRITI
ncbi:MAG: MATE family efflux transporter [Myxococcota bacterium]